MNEDQDRTRMGNGPQNLAILRHMALNLMQKDGSKEALRRRAGTAAAPPAAALRRAPGSARPAPDSSPPCPVRRNIAALPRPRVRPSWEDPSHRPPARPPPHHPAGRPVRPAPATAA